MARVTVIMAMKIDFSTTITRDQIRLETMQQVSKAIDLFIDEGVEKTKSISQPLSIEITKIAMEERGR